MTALDGLDPQQRDVAQTLRGRVCVLAGAGTGKTRAITHRIAYGVDTGAYTPNRVMAVTFTAKAAGEMRGRLRALGVAGVAARTFHASALAQLNYFWPTLTGDSAPTIVDNKVRLLAHAADRERISTDVATLRDIAAGIERRKVSMQSIERFARAHPNGVGSLGSDKVADVQRAYEALKDERRQLDFEDVLLACAGMIESEPRVAEAVREQYRHFTVDEYQDVSPLQHRLLELWVGDRRDLCVVGDANQTIYSFAGADVGFLLEFEARNPEAHMLRLETNYRSTQAILDTANALMRGRPGALSLAAAEGALGTPPKVSEHSDDDAEAEWIATEVARQVGSGARPGDIAVLYRSHAQSAAIQQALARRRIATTTLGGTRFFAMPEVRQAIMALRAASVAPLETDFVDAVRDVLRSLGLSNDPPPAGGALRDAWEARSALLRLAESAPPGTTLRAFADGLSARAKDQHEPPLDTVTLATLHAAKGLEWVHVHIAGMAEGLLPTSYASSLAHVDEERRLAYVGLTRAAQSISLSWARGTGRIARRPSRFLTEIGMRTRG